MTKTIKTYRVSVYKQGSHWVLSDKYTEQLPYWVQTKQDVRDFLNGRLKDRHIDQKLRISWD